MSKKLLVTRSLAVAAMMFAATSLSPALAAAPGNGAAPAARILIVDLRRAVMASKAGQ